MMSLIGHSDAISHPFFPSKSLYKLFPPPPVFKHIESPSSDDHSIFTPDQVAIAQEVGSINGGAQAQMPKPDVRLNTSTNSTRRFGSLPLFFNPKSHTGDQKNDPTELHVESAQVYGTEVESGTVENGINSTSYSEPVRQCDLLFSDSAEEESSLFSLHLSSNGIFERRDSNNIAPTSPNPVGNSIVSNEPIRFPDIPVFLTTPEWPQLKKKWPAPPIPSFPSIPNWRKIFKPSLNKPSLPGKRQTAGNKFSPPIPSFPSIPNWRQIAMNRPSSPGKRQTWGNQPAPPIPSFPSIPNWREIAMNRPILSGKRQSSAPRSHNIFQSDGRKETS